MKKLTGILLCLAAGFMLGANADKSFSVDQTFGGEVPAEGKAVNLKQAIADLEQGKKGFVKIQGQITEVCQAKGCWMILVDGDTYARVTFEDYGFFVPKEGAEGKTAIINGEAFFDTLSVELLQHYAEDAGKSSEEILSITEPEYVVAFTADGVIIQD